MWFFVAGLDFTAAFMDMVVAIQTGRVLWLVAGWLFLIAGAIALWIALNRMEHKNGS